MIIQIISDHKEQTRWFRDFVLEDSLEIILREMKDKAKIFKAAAEDFLYVDITDLSEDESKRILKSLSKYPNPWGVLDPEGKLLDPVEVFLLGGSDYLGPGMLGQGSLEVKRFERIWSIFVGDWPQDGLSEDKFDWADIKEGQEHEFLFFLIQLGDSDVLKKRIGETLFARFLISWKTFWVQYTQEAQGLLWMESENSLLFLFPRKNNSCPIFYLALQFLMNKLFWAFEKFRLETPFVVKMALLEGKTEFKAPGRTGTIISDAVNSVFHLGQKYAQEESLYFAQTLADLVPEGLSDLVVSEGEYEGRQILRLKRFLSLS